MLVESLDNHIFLIDALPVIDGLEAIAMIARASAGPIIILPPESSNPIIGFNRNAHSCLEKGKEIWLDYACIISNCIGATEVRTNKQADKSLDEYLRRDIMTSGGLLGAFVKKFRHQEIDLPPRLSRFDEARAPKDARDSSIASKEESDIKTRGEGDAHNLASLSDEELTAYFWNWSRLQIALDKNLPYRQPWEHPKWGSLSSAQQSEVLAQLRHPWENPRWSSLTYDQQGWLLEHLRNPWESPKWSILSSDQQHEVLYRLGNPGRSTEWSSLPSSHQRQVSESLGNPHKNPQWRSLTSGQQRQIVPLELDRINDEMNQSLSLSPPPKLPQPSPSSESAVADASSVGTRLNKANPSNDSFDDPSGYSREGQSISNLPDEEMRGKAIALADYVAERRGNMSFQKGQILWISGRASEGWLHALNYNRSNSGIVPERCVRLLGDDEGEALLRGSGRSEIKGEKKEEEGQDFPIPEEFSERFAVLESKHGPELGKFLRDKDKSSPEEDRIGAVALRVEMIHSMGGVMPCITANCENEATRDCVQDFFAQPHVRHDYRPSDWSLPYFHFKFQVVSGSSLRSSMRGKGQIAKDQGPDSEENSWICCICAHTNDRSILEFCGNCEHRRCSVNCQERGSRNDRKVLQLRSQASRETVELQALRRGDIWKCCQPPCQNFNAVYEGSGPCLKCSHVRCTSCSIVLQHLGTVTEDTPKKKSGLFDFLGWFGSSKEM